MMNLGAISIPTRYCGLPGKAHGGYCCGLLGKRIEGAAQVTLRAAPPLERPLRLESQEASGLRLWDDAMLIAEANAATLGIVPPSAVSYDDATIAAAVYSGFAYHPFPECFVCGPARTREDGLRIFPGLVSGQDVIAAPWVPDASVSEDGSLVPPEIVWAALDCPGGIALNPTGVKPVVLGRLTVEIAEPLEIGNRYVVVAWPLGTEGRKRFAGTAIFSDEQKLYALGHATWFALPV